MSDKLDAMRTTHLKRIPKGNVIARAAQEIRRLIVGQHLPEGTKLLSEHALCAQLGISRSSVREALRVLEAVGLVETIQGKGAFVRRLRIQAVPERYSAKTIEEAGLVAPAIRVIVESTCADLAARRAGTQDLRTLEAELQKYRDALASRDLEGTVAADGRFHLALARAAGNEVFCDILQALDPVATTNRAGPSTSTTIAGLWGCTRASWRPSGGAIRRRPGAPCSGTCAPFRTWRRFWHEVNPRRRPDEARGREFP